MSRSSLTINAADLYLAVRLREARESAAATRAARPCLLHRCFPSLVPHARRERTVRLSPTEIVTTNPRLP